jgi:hypothetical protein
LEAGERQVDMGCFFGYVLDQNNKKCRQDKSFCNYDLETVSYKGVSLREPFA